MRHRRTFLKHLLVHGAAMGAILSRWKYRFGFRLENNLDDLSRPYDGPIVLSTWGQLPANDTAWRVLQRSNSGLDAVESGIRVVESDPKDTSVGLGGFPDQDGHVTLDACIMDRFGNAGSVSFLENIAHPISVARAVMEKTPHVMLVGEGAHAFAARHHFERADLLTPSSKVAWERWKKGHPLEVPPIDSKNHDTIGMVIRDSDGHLFGGCSTSGWAFKMRGRVGDSPVIGAGLYVDDDIGAATATGLGEVVLKTSGTFLIVELMRLGYPPREACKEAVRRAVKKYNCSDQQIGFIAINKRGQIGAYGVRPKFIFTVTKNGESVVHKADSYVK